MVEQFEIDRGEFAVLKEPRDQSRKRLKNKAKEGDAIHYTVEQTTAVIILSNTRTENLRCFSFFEMNLCLCYNYVSVFHEQL